MANAYVNRNRATRILLDRGVPQADIEAALAAVEPAEGGFFKIADLPAANVENARPVGAEAGVGRGGEAEDGSPAPVPIAPTMKRAKEAIQDLERFVPRHQLGVIQHYCRGEEGSWFRQKVVDLAKTISEMPKTYEQDGKGDEAVAYLHFFRGNIDWWITEKDMEVEQLQAFGFTDMGYGGELGYISLEEILALPGIEIDLHFEPTTIREIKAEIGGQVAAPAERASGPSR